MGWAAGVRVRVRVGAGVGVRLRLRGRPSSPKPVLSTYYLLLTTYY